MFGANLGALFAGFIVVASLALALMVGTTTAVGILKAGNKTFTRAIDAFLGFLGLCFFAPISLLLLFYFYDDFRALGFLIGGTGTACTWLFLSKQDGRFRKWMFWLPTLQLTIVLSAMVSGHPFMNLAEGCFCGFAAVFYLAHLASGPLHRPIVRDTKEE